jgi:hypothetical protein
MARWHAICSYKRTVNTETKQIEPEGAADLSPNNKNLKRLLRLTRDMLALADEGDRDRNDASCGILYGVLRDAAYQLRNMASKECDRHKDLGKWR